MKQRAIRAEPAKFERLLEPVRNEFVTACSRVAKKRRLPVMSLPWHRHTGRLTYAVANISYMADIERAPMRS